MKVGSSSIGRTAGFGPADEGSTPSSRTMAVCAPCRLCHGPTWMADELGAVHPCCQLNGEECIGCRASESLNREQRRRGNQRGWKEVKGEGVDG